MLGVHRAGESGSAGGAIRALMTQATPPDPPAAYTAGRTNRDFIESRSAIPPGPSPRERPCHEQGDSATRLPHSPPPHVSLGRRSDSRSRNGLLVYSSRQRTPP